MKLSKVLAAFLGAIALISTGCGVSDSVKSVTLSSSGSSSGGFFNLKGVDGTVQLTVTDNYRSGKTVISTNESTFTVTPVGVDINGNALPAFGPTTVTISSTGMMTGIAPLCTWTDLLDSTTGKPATPPVWLYTGYYQVVAHHDGIASQPVAIGVGSLTSNSPTGGCGP